MKVLFSSNRNPLFETFTDYIEKAFREEGCEVVFFENRGFVLPGRIRSRVSILHSLDFKRLNYKLLKITKNFNPHLFLEDGGWNILPDTIETMKKMGIKTALWTNDPPKPEHHALAPFKPIKTAAPHYNHVFVTGTDTIEVFEGNVKNLHLLPFACEPDFHKPIKLSSEDKMKYGYDICFVGSGWKDIYPNRIKYLESLMDLNIKIGIYGPGWDTIPDLSPLKLQGVVKGAALQVSEWVKLFNASKMVFHCHYRDLTGKVPHFQANPRVFEVLACGKLLIIETQKDVLTLFKDGEHLVVFENEKDLKEKVLYYLAHPEEAQKIADNGRKKVLEKHTYRHRIKTILDIMNLNNK